MYLLKDRPLSFSGIHWRRMTVAREFRGCRTSGQWLLQLPLACCPGTRMRTRMLPFSRHSTMVTGFDPLHEEEPRGRWALCTSY